MYVAVEFLFQDTPTPHNGTVFASRRQGFTPTPGLVQNPVDCRQTPYSCTGQTPYFIGNQPVLWGLGGLMLQNGGFGPQSP